MMCIINKAKERLWRSLKSRRWKEETTEQTLLKEKIEEMESMLVSLNVVEARHVPDASDNFFVWSVQ